MGRMGRIPLHPELLGDPFVGSGRKGWREAAASGDEDDRWIGRRSVRPEGPMPSLRSLGQAGRESEEHQPDAPGDTPGSVSHTHTAPRVGVIQRLCSLTTVSADLPLGNETTH